MPGITIQPAVLAATSEIVVPIYADDKLVEGRSTIEVYTNQTLYTTEDRELSRKSGLNLSQIDSRLAFLLPQQDPNLEAIKLG